MSYTKQGSFSGETLYHRYFSSFRGLDLSADEATPEPYRFANISNMWKDWQSDDGTAVETFPGYRLLHQFPGRIYGIYTHMVLGKEYLVIHSGKNLYRFPAALRDQPKLLEELTPLTTTLPEESGCAFQVGEQLYLLTGGVYATLDATGSYTEIGEDAPSSYIPTVYQNGHAYEQQNLLTDKVKESYSAEGLPEAEELWEDDLIFTPVDRDKKYCAVGCGPGGREAFTLHIPQTAMVDGESYTVTQIASGGFANCKNLLAVQFPDTLMRINERAFYNCPALTQLILPSGVGYIGLQSFMGCTALKEVSLGIGLTKIDSEAFALDLDIAKVYYAGDADAFSAIELLCLFPQSASFIFEATAPVGKVYFLRMPLYSKAKEIHEVSLAGQKLAKDTVRAIFDSYACYFTYTADKAITELILVFYERAVLKGRQLTVLLTASPSVFSAAEGLSPFHTKAGQSGLDAIRGCRTCCEFDGRIFLSGNPAFPNTVFFSSPNDTGYNDPLYFGNLNYFNDGLSALPNRALLSTGGMLLVIKGDESGQGSVYYHTPQSTEHGIIPRIYPVQSCSVGIGATGCAINFRDDPVILTNDGLMGIYTPSSGQEKGLAMRSSNINLALCREPLAKAQAAVFEGYLFLLIDGTVYLADSRETFRHAAGSTEYEWYRLEGVGSFTDDRPLYRYSEQLPPLAKALGMRLADTPKAPALGEIKHTSVGLERLYYVTEGEEKLLVDWDGERTGGHFCPADRLCGGQGALYFGTPDGSLCCFNTDKRGQMLYRTASTAYYRKEGENYLSLSRRDNRLHSEDEISTLPLYYRQDGLWQKAGDLPVYQNGNVYQLVEPIEGSGHAGRIPSYYYSFAGHPFLCGCATKMDNAGIPHLAKSTAVRSGVIRLKVTAPTHFTLSVRTDRTSFHPVEQYRLDNGGFDNTDFAAFCFAPACATSLPLRERERRWVAKQYQLCAEVFRTPFGLYELAYSFRISGRIKA